MTASAGDVIAVGGVFERRPPLNLAPEDRPLFEGAYRYDCPDATIERLEDVTVSARGDLFQGLRVLPASFPSAYHFATRKRGRYLQRALDSAFRAKKRVKGDRLWITDQWSANYFHWFCDCLPRLEASLAVLDHPTVMLPHKLGRLNFVLESLGAFEIGGVDVMPTRPSVARVEGLWLPSATAGTGNFNTPLIRRVSERLHRHFGCDARTNAGGARVYISRAKATRRRVLGEEGIADVLSRHGVERYFFEDLPFARQVCLSADAGLLVSLHGAGLANMLFMAPGSTILEIRQRGDARNNCYFSLANALGHRYVYMLAEPATENQDPATGDVHVDPTALDLAIRAAKTR